MSQELNFFGAFLNERYAILEPKCSEKWARIIKSSFRSDAPHWHTDVVSNQQGFPYFYGRM